MTSHTGGIEIETYGVSETRIRNAIDRAGIRGCKVVPDGTPNVDAEIVLPPLGDCDVAKQYLREVCQVLENVGCQINTQCGLHIHISNAPLADGVTPAAFTSNSITHAARTGEYLSNHGEPLDAAIVKDIMQRYERQQDTINTMLAPSRTNNTYCKPLNAFEIEQANTISELNHGKFFAINLDTWRRGTIEFRQHGGTIDADKIWNWFQFLLNLVYWTKNTRFENAARTIVQDTPVTPFRRNSRVGVQYTMMRNGNGGVTTRDIMDATGCSEQRVRAAVSEIRTRVGDGAVITHTQQANGGSYGDGTDLTRYEVLTSFETTGGGVQLRDESERGIPSIWAGTSDDLFEWWQDRIEQLAR